ncbi:hypothetical protein CYMTET_47527 [Cymbomonas tetramitiformis]|uniref:Uncharacterized protein n=1 Tax=Cymbomonas tetramitiformis TaxID=36881 RepID=A0AAE0BVU8_9CHLO|nr:hypothetical protein CYMTET_47527 [Cymbomonas tetramitiformis]
MPSSMTSFCDRRDTRSLSARNWRDGLLGGLDAARGSITPPPGASIVSSRTADGTTARARGSAEATFLAVIKTEGEIWHENDQVCRDKEYRFQTDESTREDYFNKVNHELKFGFVDLDLGVASLVNLIDVTLVMMKDANELLFNTLELLVRP